MQYLWKHLQGSVGCGQIQCPWFSRTHTCPSGQSAASLSPKPEPHLKESKLNPSNSQENRGTRKLSELDCFCWDHCWYFRENFHVPDLSGKSSYLFHKLGNQVESHWNRLKKNILMTLIFSLPIHCFQVFSILRVPCYGAEKSPYYWFPANLIHYRKDCISGT